MKISMNMIEQSILQRTMTEWLKPSSTSLQMQPDWYDDMEETLHDFANGSVDSTVCAARLTRFGITDVEEAMDVKFYPSQAAS